MDDGLVQELGSACEVPRAPSDPRKQITSIAGDSGDLVGLRKNGELIRLLPTEGPEPLGSLPSGVRYTAVKSTSPVVALRSDGQIDILGESTSHDVSVPKLLDGRRYVDLALGDSHYVALRDDGTVVAWGDNSFGQCDTPSLHHGSQYTQVAAGGWTSAARRDDGTVAVWGDLTNLWGWGPSVLQSPSAGQVGCMGIPAGGMRAVTVREDGAVIVWPTLSNPSELELQEVLRPRPGSSWVKVSIGGRISALTSDGTILEWGELPKEMLGVDERVVVHRPRGDQGQYVGVASGGTHTLALRRDGYIVAWGMNFIGQCDVPPLPRDMVYVGLATGEVNSLAWRSDGSVVIWGHPDFPHVDRPLRQLPSPPPGVLWEDFAMGGSFLVGLRSDGVVMAWGSNAFGQCNVPPLPRNTRYTSISAGESHAVALRSDGQAIAWGCNSHGECRIPQLPPGAHYKSANATKNHCTLLVRANP